jgi:hypothetical protein
VVETPWGFESPRPHPAFVGACLLVPLPAAMTEAQARRRVAEAVTARLSDPFRAMILDSIRQESVIIDVAGAADLPQPLPDQCAPGASIFVVVSAPGRASLMAVHEWKARGPAAALAASIDAPLIDAISLETLDAQEALASLPTVSLSGPSSRDLTFGFSLRAWGGCERDLREELQDVLLALAFKIFSGLAGQAQATPEAQNLMKLPRSVPHRVPARRLGHGPGRLHRERVSRTLRLREASLALPAASRRPHQRAGIRPGRAPPIQRRGTAAARWPAHGPAPDVPRG